MYTLIKHNPIGRKFDVLLASGLCCIPSSHNPRSSSAALEWSKMAELEDVTLDGKPLHSLRVADLKAALEQRGLAKSGQKNALIKRLKGVSLVQGRALNRALAVKLTKRRDPTGRPSESGNVCRVHAASLNCLPRRTAIVFNY